MQNKIINSLFKSFKVNLIWLINCLVVFTVFSCQPKELSLEENFKNPPASVNPWCYWYWYSDNISKEGIDKDLKAMSEVGITTVLIGNVTQGGVQGTVEALTDEWWDMVKYAIKQAGEYGIDVGFFNCPGWSQSGGPWISDEQSMRHIITNEVYAKGNNRFDEEMWAPEGFYQDVRVLAFPTPKNDKVVLTTAQASVTTSIKGVNPSHLIDGDPSTVFTIPEEALSANRFEVEIEAKEAFEARSLILQPAPQQFIMDIQLYAQLEGEDYTLLREFNFQRPPKGDLQIGPMFDAPKVISFPVLTATKFKLVFSNFSYHAFYGRNNQNPGFGEIAISGAYRLDHFIEKKLSKVFPMPLPMWHDYMWEKSNDADVQELLIDETQLIDLTDKIDDNRLVWDVPEGDWTIVRVMMVSTGAKNSPVLPAAQGPEVDKLTKELAYHHFDSYIGRLIREMPEEDRKALKYCVIDSYEQGSQNWTDNLEKPFRERYGYDPIPYLAAFTGRVVGSVEKTERFFWDLRRMIADRVAHEYAAGMRERSNQNGLKLWMENYGHWGFPGESLQYGGQGDILAGEFWAQGDLGSIEIKAAASASNLYDKGIVCCESFTSGPPNFFLHPWSIKCRGDWSMTEGVNQVVLHVYLHQPDDVRIPGVNAPFGTEFNRHNTWFYTMGGFIDYTKRNSYMLQQGKFVADVLYFTGEDAPKMTGIQDPALPKGYAFDYINSEVIMGRLDVKKGKFVLPNGIKYSVLVLPDLDNMRPELLAKIKTLIEKGGVVMGEAPKMSPSLQNYPNADEEVKKLAAAIWHSQPTESQPYIKLGKGKVFTERDLTRAFAALNIQPDINLDNASNILWIHRETKDMDIYFVSNQAETYNAISPVFRIYNRQPELWNSLDGSIQETANFEISRAGTMVNLNLKPLESVFVVFRKGDSKQVSVVSASINGEPAITQTKLEKGDKISFVAEKEGSYRFTLSDGKTKNVKVSSFAKPIDLSANWVVNFSPGRDAPEYLHLEKLISWTDSPIYGVKYYSGSAVYKKDFSLPASYIGENIRVMMDLGDVQNIADVTINGSYLGNFWTFPMQLDITNAVKTGSNQLEIKITNNWRNRVVGDIKYKDAFPGTSTKKEFNTIITTNVGLTGEEELMLSGLIGPVRIYQTIGYAIK